ncbi:substrate-binding domain-containing protein [Heliomicrobium gestii]|uniref:substrate-binding domain-containing protein n=1 Tax=Heliomicrobium gestii TaxID=2699 RepID=UPI002E28D7FF|nr:substrate-binding domain-containing protein [Heliomicrobium gestii]MBM7865573.1 putative molybdopterin biosynthesis protein [Heliomicrobium gestii]
MPEDTSLTPEEVAERLRIKKNTVYEMIKRGDLPAYRVGRKLRVLSDAVDTYVRQGQSPESPGNATVATAPLPPAASGANPFPATATPAPGASARAPLPTPFDPWAAPLPGMVLCGQDPLLDILANQMERHPRGTAILRSHVGSFNGLLSLYQGTAHIASAHLWDSDSGQYNIPYIRRLIPGIPTVLIGLVRRMQGFYVAQGNPKNIADWHAFSRSDIRYINRERGCGTRVLLDEKLRQLGIDSQQIAGYRKEVFSHLSVASAIARDEADYGLGTERAARQVSQVDFVPLQKEEYHLVVKKEDFVKPLFQSLLEIIRSAEFRAELRGMGGYDLDGLGEIVAEI